MWERELPAKGAKKISNVELIDRFKTIASGIAFSINLIIGMPGEAGTRDGYSRIN